MDEHVASTFGAALGLLSKAGARIVEIEVPEFARLATINTKGGLVAGGSMTDAKILSVGLPIGQALKAGN